MIVIMRGLPGSGKSTLAQKEYQKMLVEYQHGDYSFCPVILSTDQYYMVGQHYCYNPSLAGLAHGWNQWRAKNALEKNYIPIIDNTNINWSQIKPYVEIALQYNPTSIILVGEPSTPWKFDVNECFRRNTHNVPKEVIQTMSDKWEDTGSIQDRIEELRKEYE